MDPAQGIVGRQEELERLDRVLDTLDAERQGRIVELVGEPGIGKTRLMTELCERAEDRGYLVLSGMAAEFERELPFGPFVDALDSYLEAAQGREIERLGGGLTGELAMVFPSLREYAEDGATRLQDERHNAYHAVRNLLERLAATRPMVLALDDVHWADEASLELLASLQRRPPAAPVLIALCARTGQEQPVLTSTRRAAEQGGWLARTELGPLSAEEAGELVGELRPGEADALISESGGNPFYLTELVRMSTRGGGNGAGPPDGPGTLPGDPAVPPGVTAALDQEIEGLSEGGASFLRAASVAGEPFDLGLAADVCELPEREALEVLDELVDEGMVHPTEVPRRFLFRHPLVRKAVYQSCPAGWRIAAHARAADALARRGADLVERAHHVERSAAPGDTEAVDLLEEAAQVTAPRAPAAAIRWLEAALRLLPQEGPGAERRIGMLILLATSLSAVGRFRESVSTVAGVLEALPEDAGILRIRLVAACASLKDLLGDHMGARDGLMAHYSSADDGTAEKATLEVELAVNAFWTMDFEEMRTWGARAVATAEPLGDRVLRGTAAAILAYAETLLGEVADAESHRSAAAADLDAAGDDELALRLEGLSHLGWTEYFLGHLDGALAHTERGLAISRQSNQGQFLTPLRLGLSSTLATLGRLAEAREASEATVESARFADNPKSLCHASAFTCWWAALQGDLEDARRAGAEAMGVANELGESALLVVAGAAMAECQVLSGEPEQAARLLRETCGGPEMGLVPDNWQPLAFEILTRAELGAGRLEAAEEAATRAEAAAERLGLEIPIAHAHRARGQVLLAAGDPATAAEEALAAVAADERAGAGEQESRSRLLAGRALAAAGERDRAIAMLREAESAFEASGSVRFRAQASRELRRLGQRSGSRRRGGATGDAGLPALTAREREIAELVTDRLTNREIAEQLVLSEKTIETHLRNIFAKLGATSRVEVARTVEGERDKIRG